MGSLASASWTPRLITLAASLSNPCSAMTVRNGPVWPGGRAMIHLVVFPPRAAETKEPSSRVGSGLLSGAGLARLASGSAPSAHRPAAPAPVTPKRSAVRRVIKFTSESCQANGRWAATVRQQSGNNARPPRWRPAIPQGLVQSAKYVTLPHMTELTERATATDALPLGPQSLVWRYFGDNRMFLIGPRPALLQNMLAELR